MRMARQSDDRQCGGRPLEGKKKKVTLEQATSNASDDVHTISTATTYVYSTAIK